ncbi:PAS domain S-box protein [Campylobacterota bacterium DY0563]
MNFKSKTTLFFIISLFISILLFFLAYLYSKNIITDSYKKQIETSLFEINKSFDSLKKEKIPILNTIVNHNLMKKFIKTQESEDLKKLFADFIKANQKIFQIRVIDLKGNEIVRVAKNNNIIEISKNEELQDKSNRYYVKKFLNLEKNQIGFSNLDLNIENDQIEKPYKATLRTGMPVFNGNKKSYVVTINYIMNDFLETVLEGPNFNKYLLDEDGYFIIHKDKNLNWSRYLDKQIKVNDVFSIDLENKKLYDNESNIVLKTIYPFDTKYYILYELKKDLNIIKFIDKSKQIGILLFFAAIFLVLPFILLLYNYLIKLKKVNRDLKDSTNKIETILNNTSDAIVVIDKKGMIQEVNNAVIKIFGYEKGELLNKNVNILIPSPHHEKHDEYVKNHDKDVHSEIINKDRELYGLHKDGSFVNISLIVTKVKINDELFFIGNIKDLTQESKNKKLFQNVFDVSPVGIALVLEDGSFWRISNKFCSIVGYEREELINLTFKDITYKEDLGKDINLVKKLINKEIDEYYLEKRYIKKDGEIVWVKLTVVPVYVDNDKRKFDYFISTIDDISEIKKLEEEKIKKEHLLMNQSKLAAMGEMTSAIAHQWRQPLNSIGFIIQDLISAYKHNEFDEKYLYEIKAEVMEQLKYMSDTIDEFRKFFKKDEPKTKFNILKTVFDINKLYLAQLNSHNIKLTVKVDNNVVKDLSKLNEFNKYIIENQEGQLKQVLLNCVSNAKDAIQSLKNPSIVEKQIFIELSMDKEGINIAIKDLAGGITKENQSRIFEPYFSTKNMGTGLGLYICKSICEKSLNAKINYYENNLFFEERVYKGSSFVIKLLN